MVKTVQMNSPTYRPLDRKELETLIEWAAAEGWNPGLHDAEAFWAADPAAFVGVDHEGELIGGGAIVNYAGQAGFMGLFIMKPEWRSRGLGRAFWYYRRDRLRSRLQRDAWIAMDGVFAMQPFYAKGGFQFTHRNLRMEGVGKTGTFAPELTALSELAFAEVEEFDRRYFLVPRRAFLKKWINPEGGKALGFIEANRLAGYGVIRPCRTGYKIGPLFAETTPVAESLFLALSTHAVGAPIVLDVPEINEEAMKLVSRHGMKEIFGCARMVMGRIPPIPWSSIYGVTTFELG